MLIVCPNCVCSYQIDPEFLQQSHGSVRCSQCHTAWTISDPGDRAEADERGSVRIAAEPRPGSLIGAGPSVAAFVRSTLREPSRDDRERASPFRVVLIATAILAVGSGLIGWRKPIVRSAPAMASVYTLAGLAVPNAALTLQNVTTAMVLEGSIPVLTLEGTIENGRTEATRVPDIRIVVRDGAAQGLYTWVAAAPKAKLAPGESVPFKTRLVAPPGNGHDVEVGFSDARVTASDVLVKGPK